MKQKSLLVSVLTIAMALVLALTCILYCAAPGKQVSAEGEAAAPAATAPTATASYDFTSADFDQSEWTKTGEQASTVTITPQSGLSISQGSQNKRSGYAIENPLKGKLTDGFSIMGYITVTDIIFDAYPIFGFYNGDIDATKNSASDPEFFIVAGTGSDVRLNINGTEQSSGGSKFYDAIGGAVLDMTTLSQYVITVDRSAIHIYLDGRLCRTLSWTPGDTTTYGYETIDFINEASYFALGFSGNFGWGNAVMTAQQIYFYDTALTVNADFTILDAFLDKIRYFSVSNYNTDAADWDTAYSAFVNARSVAEGLNRLTATQTQVDGAYNALNTAYNALTPFLRDADITEGLVSAFPLNSTSLGTNIVTNSTDDADKVIFMNGSNAAGAMTDTEQLTADHFATYQGVSAAKLYEDEYLSTHNNLNPYADRAATSKTMGLDIPASAFAGVSSSTGLTITVNAYIENFYSGAWGRIFQLGEREMSSSNTYIGDGQIFVSVNGVAATDINGSTVMPNSTNVCSILARQWYSISIVLDPSANTITIYTSGYQLNDSGAIEYMFGWYTAQTTNSNVTTLIGSIISDGAENWLGRSFWDTADTSVVGAASNLSVYNRPLTATEVEMLHGTSDLSTLIANA